MNGSRISTTLGVALACFALNAIAQGTTTTDPKMAAPPATTADPKKAEPKKAAPKKAAPKKAPAKTPPKKVDGKPAATSQGGTIQVYEAGKAPDLKDSKGNTIPTSPDAYDVSSGTSAPPKKK